MSKVLMPLSTSTLLERRRPSLSPPSSPPSERSKTQPLITSVPSATSLYPVTPTLSAYPSPSSMNLPSVPLKDAPADQSQEGGLQPSSQRYHPSPLLPRRESFHCSSNRPHPPPFRTSLSSVGPMTNSNLILDTPTEEKASPKFSTKRGKEENVDKEELTTKGRKRKRLAKACSACHVSCFVFLL